MSERPSDRRPLPIIDDAAGKVPLAPEPFLVRGVQAELAGNSQLAAQAFAAAEWRDPRSLPARYFLADLITVGRSSRHARADRRTRAAEIPNGSQTIAALPCCLRQEPVGVALSARAVPIQPRPGDASLTALARDPGLCGGRARARRHPPHRWERLAASADQ